MFFVFYAPGRGYNDNVISNRGAHRKQTFGFSEKLRPDGERPLYQK